MKQRFFIAGTDTGIGKTWVTCLLLRQLQLEGYAVLGIKPVASGGTVRAGKVCNEDALLLGQFSSVQLPYEQTNPFQFTTPVSPNFAAAIEQRTLTSEDIVAACEAAYLSEYDVMLVEGVGGWLAPLNHQETMADVAKRLNFPIILVIGLRLGCLNHALLTYESILHKGLNVAGWVGNQIEPDMLCLEENINFLQQKIAAPCFGIVPYTPM